jgi:DNA polymerase
MIPQLWQDGDDAIRSMFHGGGDYYFDRRGSLIITKEGIRLPNGLHIRYPNITLEQGKFTYKSRKGPVSIWGGVIVENVVQALARIIVATQMLKVAERYKVACTVHDSIVAVVHKDKIDEAVNYITECMSTPPSWAEGLPITCEAKYAQAYGQC